MQGGFGLQPSIKPTTISSTSTEGSSSAWPHHHPACYQFSHKTGFPVEIDTMCLRHVTRISLNLHFKVPPHLTPWDLPGIPWMLSPSPGRNRIWIPSQSKVFLPRVATIPQQVMCNYLLSSKNKITQPTWTMDHSSMDIPSKTITCCIILTKLRIKLVVQHPNRTSNPNFTLHIFPHVPNCLKKIKNLIWICTIINYVSFSYLISQPKISWTVTSILSSLVCAHVCMLGIVCNCTVVVPKHYNLNTQFYS